MLKIDLEKFDLMLNNELAKDERYAEIKNLLKGCSQIDIEKMATFLFCFSEKIYNRAFVDGMNFIINKEEVDLFSTD